MLLDGAMGTELSRRGYQMHAPLWSAGALLDASELVEQIHCDYASAGADMVTTNSFGLRSASAEHAISAVERARTANKPLLGSIGPADPRAPQAQRLAHYHDVGSALRDAGVDVLFAETHVSVAGAREACTALQDLGLPVWVAISCVPQGHTLHGDDLREVTLEGAAMVLIGCSEHTALLPALEALAPRHARLGVKPSLGHTHDGRFDPAGATEPEVVRTLVQLAKHFDLAAIGGCCGTTPAFTSMLREQLA